MVRSMGTAWGVGGEGRSVLRSGVARASDAQGLQFTLAAVCRAVSSLLGVAGVHDDHILPRSNSLS